MANQSVCLSRIPKKQHALSVHIWIFCVAYIWIFCDGHVRVCVMGANGRHLFHLLNHFQVEKNWWIYTLHTFFSFLLLMQRVYCACQRITGRCPVGIATLYTRLHNKIHSTPIRTKHFGSWSIDVRAYLEKYCKMNWSDRLNGENAFSSESSLTGKPINNK